MAYAVHNFDYNTPTRLLFGRGKIERLPEVAAVPSRSSASTTR